MNSIKKERGGAEKAKFVRGATMYSLRLFEKKNNYYYRKIVSQLFKMQDQIHYNHCC